MPPKKKPKLKQDDIPQIVHELLESYFWLPTLAANTRYARLQDDHDGTREGWLAVTIGEDGDAWVDPLEPSAGGLRFRIPLHGGGMSQRTRTALVILAEAIRLDNEEKPQGAPGGVPGREFELQNPNDALRWVCGACNTVNPIDMTACLGCKKPKPLEKKAT
jgi:hypothetical protein